MLAPGDKTSGSRNPVQQQGRFDGNTAISVIMIRSKAL